MPSLPAYDPIPADDHPFWDRWRALTPHAAPASTLRALAWRTLAIALAEHHHILTPADAQQRLATIDATLPQTHSQRLFDHALPDDLPCQAPEFLGRVYETMLGWDLIGDPPRWRPRARRRQQSGVFFTPRWLVEHVVSHTLAHAPAAQPRCLDLACGGGAFLLEVLRQSHTPPTLDARRDALHRLVWGIDIDPEAVALCRTALALEAGRGVARCGDDFDTLIDALQPRIRVGDSLAGPPQATGDDVWSHFLWHPEFTHVRDAGGFDVVLSNPPFLREPGNRPRFAFRHSHLGKFYQGKMDLWYAFASLALELLREHGVMGWVATHGWLSARGASLFRNKLHHDATLLEVCDFASAQPFGDAAVHICSWIARKHPPPPTYHIPCWRAQPPTTTRPDTARGWFRATIEARTDGSPLVLVSDDVRQLLKKISAAGTWRLQNHHISQGIVANIGRVQRKHLPHLDDAGYIGAGVFVLDDDALAARPELHRAAAHFGRPYHTRLTRYGPLTTTQQILYITDDNCPDIQAWPNLEHHLRPFRPIMARRRETQRGSRPWYALHWPRRAEIFEAPGLLCTRKTRRPTFCYTPGGHYPSLAINVILTPDIDPWALLAVLNSHLVAFWLWHHGKRQGAMFQLDRGPLCRIPLPWPLDPSLARQLHDAAHARHGTHDNNQARALEGTIDRLVCRAYQLSQPEADALRERSPSFS